MQDAQQVELGTWIGRGQSFGLLASRCSAAQAECLKKIREEAVYKAVGLTWEQYCKEYAGVSRSYADEIIRRLDEFGSAYFHLAEIMHLSPDSYRSIASSIEGESIDIGGERVPITPENAKRIRDAILATRKETDRARAELKKTLETARHKPVPTITSLQSRLDVCLQEMGEIINRSCEPSERAALNGLLHYATDRLKRLSRLFQQRLE